MADNNIAGRLALITGASSGYVPFHSQIAVSDLRIRIGAACARDLATRGVHLALTYSTNRTSMEKIVADIKSSNADAPKLRLSIHKVDVGIPDEIANMFKEVQEQHQTHIDILVSNAGYGKRIVDVW